MNHSVLRSSIPWVLLDSLVSLGSAVVIAMVTAKIIGPTAFGLASTAYIIGSFAETFVSLPFSDAIVQRRDLDERTVNSAFTCILITGIVAFLVLCFLSIPISKAFGEAELIPLICAQSSTCLLVSARGVDEALLVREFRFKELSIRNIVSKLVSMAAAIVLSLNGAGAWSVVACNILFHVVSTLLILHFSSHKPRITAKLEPAIELLRFGVFALVDGLVWSATPRLFCLLYGQYQGMAALGFLNVAFRINDAICALIGSVANRFGLSMFSRLTEDNSRLERAFLDGSKVILFLAAPVFVGIAIVSNDLIALTLGSSWSPAAASLVAVSIYSVFNFSRVLASPLVKAKGRPGTLVWMHIIGLIYIAIAVPLADHLRFAQPLWAWESLGLVYFVSSVLVVRSTAGFTIRSQVEAAARPIISVLGMTIVLCCLDRYFDGLPAGQMLAVKVVAGATSYSALAVMLSRALLSKSFELRPL
jgi:O-antigen/teichoic acid export membrane protein